MSYAFDHLDHILALLAQHVGMTLLALVISTLLALPLGYAVHRWKALSGPVMTILGILYTIPSIAMIILLIPAFGLNARAVVVSLVLYNQVILVRNVAAGLAGIDPAVLEAARGMGMNAWQTWWKVQLPLALPLILAGERIAAAAAVAIAAVGAKFGAGGLGVLLFQGIAQTGRLDLIATGAILVALLALTLTGLLRYWELKTRPPEQGLGG